MSERLQRIHAQLVEMDASGTFDHVLIVDALEALIAAALAAPLPGTPAEETGEKEES